MRALSGERMLTAWERGRELREPWRALALLETAGVERDGEAAARGPLMELPLGERNGLLLDVRVLTFGRRLEGFAVCSACGAELEFAIDAGALRLPAATTAAEASGRAANSADLAAATEAADADEARAVLLERTLGVDVRAMDAAERGMWEEAFARLNAAAETECVLRCEACGAREFADFDIAGFLWREVAQGARRLLAEVHRLARAYGWSERAVLRMSAARRNAYLVLLNDELESA